MDYIDQVFGPDGYIAAERSDYIPRPGQIKMARQIHQNFEQISFTRVEVADEFSMIVGNAPRQEVALSTVSPPWLFEAPTGTGKSFAYLVPAIFQAMSRRLRTIVVTSNINLQEQLMREDLPFLYRALPYRFTFGMLKGMGNYLCVERHTAELGTDGSKKRKLELVNDLEIDSYRKVLEWGKTTKTGDRSELTEAPTDKIWRAFTVTSEDCAGDRCKFAASCHIRKARSAAKAVDILVVNYDLFLHNQKAEGHILPRYQAVVMDEGHEAPDKARQVFGIELSVSQLTWMFAKLRERKDPDTKELLAKRYAAEAVRYFEYLQETYEKMQVDKTFYLVNPLHRPDVVIAALADTAMHLTGELLALQGSKEPTDIVEAAKREKWINRCAVLRDQLIEVTTLGKERNSAEAVYFLEGNKSRGLPALRSRFIDIGKEILGKMMPQAATIITSATLALDGSYDFIAHEFGLKAGSYGTTDIESPFLWSQQARLILPAGMPEPTGLTREAYDQAVCEKVAEAIVLAGGRTLVLTTSTRMAIRTYEYVKALGLPYRLLVQGQAPNIRLAQQFREDETSCLFGTDSFWTGLDVKGPALSCLVIDKLPFPIFNDPVIDYLNTRDGGDATFNGVYVPLAIQKLRQGFGRLIRTVNDRGVVVIMDPRINTQNYGRKFMRSIPNIPQTSDMQVIRKFLTE